MNTPYAWTLQYGDNKVSRIDTSSFTIFPSGSPPGFSLQGSPVGVAVDTVRQRIWMVFDNNGGIKVIDYSGNTLLSWDGFSLSAIALDRDGNAWVTWPDQGLVAEITVDFEDGGYYDGSGADFLGVAVAPDGYVWATNYNGNKVYKINPAGYDKTATSYTAAQINKPYGIAVNKENIIFVMNAITTIGLSSEGKIIYSKGGTSRLPNNGKPNRRLYGVTIDTYGNVWCTGGNGYLVVYSTPNYNWLKTIELAYGGVPYNGISTDANGNIWVLTEGWLSSTLLVYNNGGNVIFYADWTSKFWHFGNWLGDMSGFIPQDLFRNYQTELGAGEYGACEIH